MKQSAAEFKKSLFVRVRVFVVRLIYLQGSVDSPGEYSAAKSLNRAVWIQERTSALPSLASPGALE